MNFIAAVRRSARHVKGGLVAPMVVLDLLLVFEDLAVQLVEHGVDGGVEIVA